MPCYLFHAERHQRQRPQPQILSVAQFLMSMQPSSQIECTNAISASMKNKRGVPMIPRQHSSHKVRVRIKIISTIMC